MMDEQQRAEHERAVAAAVAPAILAMRRAVIDAVRNGATAEQAAMVAARYQARLADALAAALQVVALSSSESLADSMAIGLPDDFATVAGAWARRHAIDVTARMTEVTARAIRQHVGDYFDNDMTLAELERRLLKTGLFDARRANVIAATEVTRAAAQGEKEIADALEREHRLRLVPYWLTNKDEDVCPICAPLQGLEITPANDTGGEFPPAHTRCRCSVKWVLPNGRDTNQGT